MKTLLISLLFSTFCFAQQEANPPTYRTRTLDQKNIAKIHFDKEGSQTYTYLLDEKDFLKELTQYYQAIVPYTIQVQSTAINYIKDNYYLQTNTDTHSITTLLHKVMVRDITTPYLIIGTNHCIVANNSKLCYPHQDGINCIDQQSHCQKINSKK
ncbi:hypothetical protein [Myroides phaeus]|uniref:hypothetical protein n=1 Tax=Myroides phaeus TaxID=702745 RepID=UPI0013037F4C|nr:hypothetical protein [Myroides phaeus]